MRQMRNILSHQHALISRLLNIFYPSKCPLCESTTDIYIHSPICSSCWSKIKKYTGPSCNICAMPFSSEHSKTCAQCLKKHPPFSRVINYGLYEGVIAEAINQLKFHSIKRLAKPFGKLLLSLDIPSADGIVPVPLSIKGLRERGFNQSLLIARVIAKKKKFPLFMDILLKEKETPPQIGLSARERLLNLKGVFKVKGNINGKRLLLIDDVMTTGATVTECSKVLMKGGAKEVIVLTLARSNIM
ncbi:MAG: ComF family protein [Nitrospirota bacterium]